MRLTSIKNWLSAVLGFGADVVSVTTGTVGSAGNVVASLITYLSARLLEVAELNTILDFQIGREKIYSEYLGTLR